MQTNLDDSPTISEEQLKEINRRFNQIVGEPTLEQIFEVCRSVMGEAQ
jgi:hypothetical protein